MKDKLRFLKKNKQSIIALFILLAMLFNACSDNSESKDKAFTPVGFYVDSSGNFTEKDSGRTVLIADKKANVVFYSDNLTSSTQSVGFAFDDKTIVFLFEKNQNFPAKIVLSDSEDSFKGTFTSYDSVTQSFGLTIAQGSDKETLSDVPLSKDIFTQYKDDPKLTPSQNLRIRNLYISTCIYKSLVDSIASDDSLQARRINWKKIGRFFYSVVQVVASVTEVILGGVQLYMTGDSKLLSDGIVDLLSTITDIAQGSSSGGGGGGGGGSGGASSGTTTVAVTGVSLNKTTLSLVVGDAESLVPTIVPDNATNKNVTWSNSNTAVASVSSSGAIFAISAGTTIITVRTADGSQMASCTVTVTSVPVTSISLDKTNLSMAVGETEILTATINPSNASYKNVSWSSSNNAIATVSAGSVWAKSDGTAIITATTADGNKSATCVVSVGPVSVSSVSLNKTSLSLVTGYSDTLIATLSPSNATNKNVSWKTSDSAIASVADGIITAKAAGAAIITVTTVDGAKEANCYVSVTSDSAPGGTDTGVLYAEASTYVTVYYFSGPGGVDITIPASKNGKPVIGIDNGVFWDIWLASINMPSSITYIGDKAFFGSNLASVTIPSSVTSIGASAFSGNQLTSINIPSSVTSIAAGTFSGNQLTSVTIPSSVASIGVSAFANNQLTSVTIPSSVTSIGDNAFKMNQLTSVTIPSSVTYIGSGAFFYNQLTSVTIPSSVTYIGNEAFYRNYLTSVTIPPSVTSIGAGVFYSNQLTSVIIPSSVTVIGDNAFSGNYLTSISIGENVHISNSSFDESFASAYNAHGRAAGTYTRPNSGSSVWSLQ